MRLVREDWARAAIRSVQSAIEWPHYFIFLYLACYDTVVIASRGLSHGDLFLTLRDDWTSGGHPVVPLRDADVFDGHIEWEEDRSFRIRTQRGVSLPIEVQTPLVAILTDLLEVEP